jgi:asparagine N-glycosylation enzyme membrane subunit Stt3
MNKEVKKYYGETKKFLENKKVQNIIVIILFLAILVLGISIRIEPIKNGNLIDQTTGDYTPLALDPYYFLRISETLIETGGDLPEIDSFRSPPFGVGWHKEILPDTTVLIYKIINSFNPETTLNFADVLNPVIFFALGLIVFFILIWVLAKNKWIAVISSLILTIIPPYLYRTLAGFSDHESIGMFGFFLALLFFSIGLFYLDKKKPLYWKSAGLGLIAGLMTVFSVATWGGVANFLFMILPLAFLIRWFVKEDKSMWNPVLFYGLWILGIVSFGPLFGFESIGLIKKYMLSSVGLLTLFTLGYTLIESIILKLKQIPKFLKKYPVFFSIVLVLIFGGVVYQIFVGNFFSLIWALIERIIYPFGTGRVGLTVAENKQPFLTDWIGQIGKFMFYTMFAGTIFVGGKLASGIKKKKLRPVFIGTFAFFIVGILCSRISDSSILNGTNFISKALFFISFLAIATVSIYIYNKSEWKIKTEWILVVAWMIPMLLAVRSAIRVFFAIVPFVAFIVPVVIFEVAKWGKNKKDDLVKLLSIVLTLFLIIMLLITSIGYYNSVKQQAKYQTPSYNADWQNAMGWVRNNTPEDSLFLHWWDYGYWVQTGGDRASIVDGGYHPDHLVHPIGRYVLTTPFPETAKSYMKTFDADYLLIDPTDIGKYSAYSSIADDEEVSDRASYIPTFVSNLAEIQETRNSTIRFYRGGMVLDDDLRYKDETQDIFLPKGKAGIGAMILEKTNSGYSQPEGIYIYNNKQYTLPMRFLFANGELIDFGKGINSTMYLYPNLINSQAGQQLDQEGAAMYLSEKTKDSLVAQLYLMNDPQELYPELELVHEESAYPFAFNYQGYRGPIKIYKVHADEMDNIIVREEFLEEWASNNVSMYGAFDDLEFVRI